MSDRIAVLGPGGVGGLLAARLSAAGNEVTVIGTEGSAAAISADGIELRGPLATTAFPTARSYLIGPVDVLFVAVKATDLLTALNRVPAPMVDGARIVPLLNGIDHVPFLRAWYPGAQVVPATIAVETARLRPGLIEQRSEFADIVLAGPNGHDLAEKLRSAGFTTRTSPDEHRVLWDKLTFLAPHALLTSSAGAALGQARTERSDRLEPLAEEASRAAASQGVSVDPAAAVQRLRNLPASMQSSMLRDLLAGNALELDAIAGPVIRALGAANAPATTSAVREILQRQSAAAT